MRAIWHDLECGSYRLDLPLWRELAERGNGPVLDVGAGTGRVTLDLARRAHRVTALDRDPELIEALAGRAAGLSVRSVVADARHFELDERFAVCVVPMQTVQLLGGPAQRSRFLTSARRHLRPGGRLAVAIVEEVEIYETVDGVLAPLPDVLERDGVVYLSQPTAVRASAEGFVLVRRRERVDPAGGRTVEENVVQLDALTAIQLEAEGRKAALRPAGRVTVRASREHVASTVVMLDA